MAEEIKALKHEDGTIEVEGKKFISKDSYDIVAEKQRTATEKLQKIEEANAKEKADLEKKRLEEEGKYKELAEKAELEKKQLQEQMQTEKRATALKLAAQGMKAQNADIVAKLVDMSKIEIGEDGNVKAESVTALLEGLKTEQPYLFGVVQQQNAGAGNGGAGEGGSGGGTQTIYRSQLSDSKFYQDNRDAILAAERAGAIVDDVNGGAKRD